MAAHGNIHHAMRQNYDEFGVDEYYRKVASSYRNPFYEGISKVTHAFLNRYYEFEAGPSRLASRRSFRIHDMAAGSGEATQAILEWERLARGGSTPTQPMPDPRISSIGSTPNTLQTARAPFIPPRAKQPPSASHKSTAIGTRLASIPPDTLPISVIATDPFTAPAYTERTRRRCYPISFEDLAAGTVPPDCEPDPRGVVWDIIICSFALHLVPEQEMFPLCYGLSTKAEWLVVIAPHKKPEIKKGWGWTRWDLAGWTEAGEKLYRTSNDDEESELEIVRDKVKLRLYRSTTIPFDFPQTAS